MAKSKSVYTCTECGGQVSKWQGQCPHCMGWNTLVETVAELQPDAVLLDLHMPGREPMAAMRDLIHEHPDVAIIVFSGSDDNETRRTALMSGAWCYLLKGCSGQKILDAIRAAVARKR